MRFNYVLLINSIILGLIIAGCSGINENRIVTYPPVPTLLTSNLYTVKVNNQPVWTEKFTTQMAIDSLPAWFTSEPYTKIQQEVHIANFSCGGPIAVRIEVSEPIIQAAVRPKSRKISTTIEKNILEFSLPAPDKLYIEINDLPPLCFFANPLETEQPDQYDPNVRYFGPGVHRPGLMTLKDHEVVYIAGGSVVYGGIRVEGSSDIRVLGRGILDGGFEHRRMVRLEDGQNSTFNGVLIRNGVTWTNTLVNCTNVTYRDVKVLSFGPGGDGINPLGSKQVTIDHCFLRCTDDCIAIKAPDSAHIIKNIQVTNNTMVGYAFSDGVTIGFETNGPTVSDVTVHNCDILLARGGSRVEGHSAFSIICDGPADIHNILFDDIRVEERVLKLFELHITDGTKYGINPPGHIRDIYLKNVAWAAPKPIILRGFDDSHWVKNVTFENCTIGDKPLTEAWDAIFEINAFVEGVRFK
jgi:hypothetical protein